eukprot:symbB.v1.2.028392.t1/scaffold3007.1/size65499/2
MVRDLKECMKNWVEVKVREAHGMCAFEEWAVRHVKGKSDVNGDEKISSANLDIIYTPLMVQLERTIRDDLDLQRAVLGLGQSSSGASSTDETAPAPSNPFTPFSGVAHKLGVRDQGDEESDDDVPVIETNRTVKLNKKNQYSVGMVSVDLVGTAGTITYQYWFPKNATFGKLRAKIADTKEGADEGLVLFYQKSALPEYETITSLMPIGGNLLLQPRGLEGGAVMNHEGSDLIANTIGTADHRAVQSMLTTWNDGSEVGDRFAREFAKHFLPILSDLEKLHEELSTARSACGTEGRMEKEIEQAQFIHQEVERCMAQLQASSATGHPPAADVAMT